MRDNKLLMYKYFNAAKLLILFQDAATNFPQNVRVAWVEMFQWVMITKFQDPLQFF